MANKRKPKVADPAKDVPGIGSNPATSLLMADVAMRVGATFVRKFMERGMLKGRYGPQTAHDIVGKRSVGQTLASGAAARIATRSVPGAVLVGTGLVAKLLFDRSQKRRKARQAGDAKLLDQAAEE